MRRMRRFVLVAAAAMAAVLAGCGGTAKESTKSANGNPAAAPKAVLTIQADTVAGPKNMPDTDRATKSCVLQNRYARNSQVVWRARVLDGADGTQLDDTKLESLIVKLGDGQTFPMKFGQHPKGTPTDAFWATSWSVPADYPTGTVSYTITATSKDGATATFEPFKVASSLLTITNEVLPIL